MFLFSTKLVKSENVILAIKPLHSFGLYWWKFLSWFFWYHGVPKNSIYSASTIATLKYYLTTILGNLEMDSTLININIQLKKSLQTYQGLRLHLNLPVHGQRSRTNASTQWLLANNPWKRHFVQWWNRWKFAPKDPKWFYNKYKNKNDKKN